MNFLSITIKEIGELAGVSKTTVQKSLIIKMKYKSIATEKNFENNEGKIMYQIN